MLNWERFPRIAAIMRSQAATGSDHDLSKGWIGVVLDGRRAPAAGFIGHRLLCGVDWPARLPIVCRSIRQSRPLRSDRGRPAQCAGRALYPAQPPARPLFWDPIRTPSPTVSFSTRARRPSWPSNQRPTRCPATFKPRPRITNRGLAASSPTQVSAPYRFDYAGYDGVPISLPSTRILTSEQSISDINGIAGTPLMVGRNTSVDLTKILTDGTSRIAFSAAPSAGNGHRYDVPLQMVNFPLDGQQNPSDPLPTYAPLSMAPVQLHNGSHVVESHFLIDTGAGVSILSPAVANALGINPATDTLEYLPVEGIGGTVQMPACRHRLDRHSHSARNRPEVDGIRGRRARHRSPGCRGDRNGSALQRLAQRLSSSAAKAICHNSISISAIRPT